MKNIHTFYVDIIKEILDFCIAFCAVVILFPVFVLLSVIGSIIMKGNPFFIQERPGKNKKIFKMIKFRTMTNKKDKYGNLLPDNERLTKYGEFLRSTSLDEIPELFNVLIGDMSIVGPRPLLVSYLPWYTKEEIHRHDVKPGITGYAQVNGRNNIKWDKRLALDLYYVSHVSLLLDIKIIFKTVGKVLHRSDISNDTAASEGNFAEMRRRERLKNANEYINA